MADKEKKIKNKKAKFQEGDYSDITIKGILNPKKIELKDAEMPKYDREKNSKFKSVKMPNPKKFDDKKYKSMERKRPKEYITVPSDSSQIKKFKGGGIATRGLGRAFMKGGKV